MCPRYRAFAAHYTTNTATLFFRSPSTEELSLKLLRDYAHPTLHFVDPHVQITPNNYLEHIYATYNAKSKTLEVANPMLFSELSKTNPLKDVFAEIEKHCVLELPKTTRA